MGAARKTCTRCSAVLFDGHDNDRAVGMRVDDEYDGTLYWFCPDCGWAWQAWEPGTFLHAVAQPHIDRVNEPVPTRGMRAKSNGSGVRPRKKLPPPIPGGGGREVNTEGRQ